MIQQQWLTGADLTPPAETRTRPVYGLSRAAHEHERRRFRVPIPFDWQLCVPAAIDPSQQLEPMAEDYFPAPPLGGPELETAVVELDRSHRRLSGDRGARRKSGTAMRNLNLNRQDPEVTVVGGSAGGPP